MKIGFLITARLKSSRLPLKLLMDLNGKTIIRQVMERAKFVNGVDEIILCTSTNAQDAPLVKEALNNGTLYYIGSEEDVLQRLVHAAKYFGLDYILSVTGENPLFSIEYANRVVDVIRRLKSDFVYFDGLPIGCAVYGLRTEALEVVCEVKSEIDTEIWGPLVNRPEIFNVFSERVDTFFFRPSLRITNDYLEDYLFLSKIYSHFPENSIPSLPSVLSLIDENPCYLEIHGHRKQLSLSPEKLEQIDIFFQQNAKRILDIKGRIYRS